VTSSYAICEPALWTVWQHMGDLIASSESQLLHLKASHFIDAMSSNPKARELAKEVATRFVERLNRQSRMELSDIEHMEQVAEGIQDLLFDDNATKGSIDSVRCS